MASRKRKSEILTALKSFDAGSPANEKKLKAAAMEAMESARAAKGDRLGVLRVLVEFYERARQFEDRAGGAFFDYLEKFVGSVARECELDPIEAWSIVRFGLIDAKCEGAAELVERIARREGKEQGDAARLLQASVKATAFAVRKAPLFVSGIGTFEMRKRPATSHRNARTGELLRIPAREFFAFVAEMADDTPEKQSKVRAGGEEIAILMGCIREALEAGVRLINVPKMGIFVVERVGGREGRNPMTGEVIRIAGRDRLLFRHDVAFPV